jgi:hypothetical protein
MERNGQISSSANSQHAHAIWFARVVGLFRPGYNGRAGIAQGEVGSMPITLRGFYAKI